MYPGKQQIRRYRCTRIALSEIARCRRDPPTPDYTVLHRNLGATRGPLWVKDGHGPDAPGPQEISLLFLRQLTHLMRRRDLSERSPAHTGVTAGGLWLIAGFAYPGPVCETVLCMLDCISAVLSPRNDGLDVPIGKVVTDHLSAVGPPCSLSWRGGPESDRVPPDLDQRLGLAAKPIAKR